MSEIEVPADVILPFRVMTEATFPYGLRCASCSRIIAEGQPFVSVEQRVYDDGSTGNLLQCVYCPAEGGPDV